MIPKNKVTKAIKLRPSPLLFFPAVNKLNKATIKIVIGIINSIKLALIETTPNTESSNARECPTVKRVIRSSNLRQSLKA